jgi:hypothetical protein
MYLCKLFSAWVALSFWCNCRQEFFLLRCLGKQVSEQIEAVSMAGAGNCLGEGVNIIFPVSININEYRKNI